MDKPAEYPSIVIRRRLQWPDTDASGHHHHSVIIRWVEETEAALLVSIGQVGLFGRVPRVHYEVDYKRRLWFQDEVEIRLAIAVVGRSSLTYAFEVRTENDVAAVGRMVVVNTSGGDGGAAPWPASTRSALVGGQATSSGE